MASWSELLSEYQSQKQRDTGWLDKERDKRLSAISKHRNDAIVIFYASAFLQESTASNISIAKEDINGLMNALYEAPMDNGLFLMLHIPDCKVGRRQGGSSELLEGFRRVQVQVFQPGVVAGTV